MYTHTHIYIVQRESLKIGEATKMLHKYRHEDFGFRCSNLLPTLPLKTTKL